MRASALLPLGIACCLPALCAGKPSTDPQTADDREGMDEVTVTARGDDPLAAQQNASAVELDGALLGSLPAKLEDPLAVASLFVDPAANGAGGTRIVVDGVEGDTLDVPSSSVKTVAVDSNPYSAEFSRPGKGRIEVTTWGGSLVRQHRRFELAYRDNHFDATNPFDTVHPSRQRDWGAGQFDGPWLGGKATFFVGGDYLRDNDNSFTTALTPSGAVSEPLPFPRRTAHLIARSDFRTPLHTLSLRYNWSDDRQTNQGVGAFDLPERAWNSRNRTHELRISDVARVGTDFRNDLRFDFRYRPKIADSMSDAPAVLVNGAFNGGGAQVSRQSVEKDIDFQDLVSYRVGPHSLRFGGLAKSRLIDYTDASNFGGTYTFSDLPNFVNNLPRQYTVNGGNPRVRFTQNEFAYFLQDEIRLRPRLNLLLGVRHELQSNLDEHADLAPRLALSAASEDGRTIVRAGSGIFYQRQPVTLEEQYLLLDGSNLRQVVLTNPSYPLTGDPFAQAGPPNVLRLAPHLRAPYDIQASLGVERRLGEHTTLPAEYTRLRRFAELRHPLRHHDGLRRQPGHRVQRSPDPRKPRSALPVLRHRRLSGRRATGCALRRPPGVVRRQAGPDHPEQRALADPARAGQCRAQQRQGSVLRRRRPARGEAVRPEREEQRRAEPGAAPRRFQPAQPRQLLQLRGHAQFAVLRPREPCPRAAGDPALREGAPVSGRAAVSPGFRGVTGPAPAGATPPAGVRRVGIEALPALALRVLRAALQPLPACMAD